MKKNNYKVLVIATSEKTRGGITDVINAHKKGNQWKKFNCTWVPTHIDKGFLHKLFYFLRALLIYAYKLPLSNLVHIHLSEPSSAIRKLPFVFLAKICKRKVIVHFHSFSPKTTIHSKHKKIYEYLFRKSNNILVLSEYWKNEINKTFNLGYRVKVIYNPCNKPDYDIYFKRRKYILYAGTLNKRKGYIDLLKSFSLIASTFPDWKITFAGNGEIEEAKDLTKELNIENQVVFLGWISGKEKSKAFQEASVFCLPSYAEGFPMAVLDAFSYELPVITTPVGGLPDILLDGKNALIFKPGDIKTLSKTLKKLLTNNSLRLKLAIESKILSESTFNLNRINTELENIYLDLLN